MSTPDQITEHRTLGQRMTMERRGIPQIGAGMSDSGIALVYPNGAYCDVPDSDEYKAAKSKLAKLMDMLEGDADLDAGSRNIIESNAKTAKHAVKVAKDRILDAYGLADTDRGVTVIRHWHATRFGTTLSRDAVVRTN